MARAKKSSNDTTANLGFEAKLWAAADALRNNMDADVKRTWSRSVNLVGVDAEGRILLRETLQGEAHLLLVGLGSRLHRVGDHRIRELHLLESDDLFEVAQRVARDDRACRVATCPTWGKRFARLVSRLSRLSESILEYAALGPLRGAGPRRLVAFGKEIRTMTPKSVARREIDFSPLERYCGAAG